MATIIRDDGFHISAPINYENTSNIWLEPDANLREICFEEAKFISVHFPNFSDGRGFGIAKTLRSSGFCGTLRAVGYLISDQYPMARRVGFDEVEIFDEIASRQSETQWLARSNWQRFDYQSRLRQEVKN